MAEELRLVERFEELRAGMLVVYKPCLYCQGRHRFMLLRLRDEDGINIDTGVIERMFGWTHAPERLRCDTEEAVSIVTPEAVQRRSVFVVDTGLEAPSETRTARKRERVGR